MRKEQTGFKHPMVDLLTGATMWLMYLNALAASNLFFLKGPLVFMKECMKELESGSMAVVEKKEPLPRNH